MQTTQAIPINTSLVSIHSEQLVTVTGGGAIGKTLSVGGKVLRGAGPVANVLASGYDAYSGYNDSRARGKGVGKSLANGAKEVVKGVIKGVTFYDFWKPTPAY